jgi:molybdopterin converting factor small subunit
MASINEINIRLFGAFRDCSQESVFPIAVKGHETARDLKILLGQQLVQKLAVGSKLSFDIEALVAKSVLATDDRILEEGEIVSNGELSILPPVCGG